MASSSHSRDLIKDALILELHDQVETLTKENTNHLETIKKLRLEMQNLRQTFNVLKPLGIHLNNAESAISRFMSTIEDPQMARQELLESIVRAHEKKMTIDSDSLPQ